MTAACIEVLCCPLTAVDAALLSRYENLLSAEELQRLHGFHAPASAKEFLVGRALLRSALATRIRCAPHELQFSKNSDGKPALSFPASNWQFNLTHSHDWVALVLCEGHRVGIDIESYVRRNNLPAIAQRFFSDDENAHLAQYRDSEWLDNFLAIWTLKEAHAKALGCGLSKILSCSSVGVDLHSGKIEWALSGVADCAENVASWFYRLDANCALAVVAHGAAFLEPQLAHCVPLQRSEPAALTRRAHGMRVRRP